jgi:Mn-dependent DtxR family transcriptional regulator
MNFQQLEYIVALEKHKNFVAAANACFVSQPTLSMMVKKLEEELEIVIVRRGMHPLEFTEEGLSLKRVNERNRRTHSHFPYSFIGHNNCPFFHSKY